MTTRTKRIGRPPLPDQEFDWRTWVGKRLARERDASALSQEQLATMVGVNKATLVKWELGERAIPSEAIPRICDALGIKVNRFFGEMPTKYIDTSDAA